jgi:hypothetical protein
MLQSGYCCEELKPALNCVCKKLITYQRHTQKHTPLSTTPSRDYVAVHPPLTQTHSARISCYISPYPVSAHTHTHAHTHVLKHYELTCQPLGLMILPSSLFKNCPVAGSRLAMLAACTIEKMDERLTPFLAAALSE